MSTGRHAGGSLRPMGAVGVAWGSFLLIGGNDLFRRLEGRAPTRGEHIAVGILGARHIAQGLLQLALPYRFARLYTGIDAVHAISMYVLAVAGPRRRRAALVSGTAASCDGWIAWQKR